MNINSVKNVKTKGPTSPQSVGEALHLQTAASMPTPFQRILSYGLQLLNAGRLVLFDPLCLRCEQQLVTWGETHVCSDCLSAVNALKRHGCRQCGRFISNQRPLCGECIIQPPPYERHVSYAAYDGVMRDLILFYKYGNMQQLKPILIHFYILAYYEEINQPFDFITAVPADTGRRRKWEPVPQMVKTVARKLRIPMLKGNLVKIKKTEPQAGLTRSRRLRNLDGAFKVLNPQQVSGKHILLLDDIYTTGTTVSKCAGSLQKAGAKVTALTLARSV